MENTEMMCPLKWDFWMLWEMTEGKEKQNKYSHFNHVHLANIEKRLHIAEVWVNRYLQCLRLHELLDLLIH